VKHLDRTLVCQVKPERLERHGTKAVANLVTGHGHATIMFAR
jgi:hypothetical protein